MICAGINRELGPQTYDAVHIRGTAAAVEAARRAGVGHVGHRQLPAGAAGRPSAYHRSKWAAEAIVREGGIPFTVLKCGVIYGRGDHLLDHLSHALHTFPVFGLVGIRERPVAPVAVDDVARILVAAALGDPRLRDRTLAVLGPETLPLGEAVRRVGAAVGRRPVYVRLPVAAHHVIARVCELSCACRWCPSRRSTSSRKASSRPPREADPPPPDLAPATPFSEASIRAGLPDGGPVRLSRPAVVARDLRRRGALDRGRRARRAADRQLRAQIPAPRAAQRLRCTVGATFEPPSGASERRTACFVSFEPSQRLIRHRHRPPEPPSGS